jgi:hypothetical protein
MRRLVLQPDASEVAIEAAAASLGWTPTAPSDLEDEDVRRDFVEAQGRRARWVDDSLSGWSYLLVPSRDDEAWRNALFRTGSMVSRDQALAVFRAARDLGDLREAVLLLGLFAYGPLDQEVFASIAAALLSTSDVVRHAALSAITYSSWSEFGPLLREGLKEAGLIPEVLHEARDIADRMDAEGWHGQYYSSDP